MAKLCIEKCEKCYESGGKFFCEESQNAGNEGEIDKEKEIPEVCEKKGLFVPKDTRTKSLFEGLDK